MPIDGSAFEIHTVPEKFESEMMGVRVILMRDTSSRYAYRQSRTE